MIKVFKAVSCVVLCENPPLFSLRHGRGWRTPEGEDFACGCVALQVNRSNKAGSGGRGDGRQPWAYSSGWDRITFPLITWPFSENGGKILRMLAWRMKKVPTDLFHNPPFFLNYIIYSGKLAMIRIFLLRKQNSLKDWFSGNCKSMCVELTF